MSKFIADITMSLDGYIAGTDISKELPLGKNGKRLHDWMFTKQTELDNEISKEMMQRSGAVVIGHRTYFDAVYNVWEGINPFTFPAFVVTTSGIPDKYPAGFQFATKGIQSALEEAAKAAGNKDVWIMGGANTIREALKTNLVDELSIHIAPILLGNGTKLFQDLDMGLVELELITNRQTEGATHLKYRVITK